MSVYKYSKLILSRNVVFLCFNRILLQPQTWAVRNFPFFFRRPLRRRICMNRMNIRAKTSIDRFSSSLFQEIVELNNVFYRYFAQYGYFDRAESSIFQVRWQRQRDDSSHIFAIWRVSRLDLMIISPRAKSEMNFLQNSSQLHLLRKCTFRVFSSHDHEHMTCFIKRYLYVFVKFVSHDIQLAKVHLRSKRNCDEF
jgi:hypothetical protein